MLTVVVSLHQQTPPTLWDWEKQEWGWTRKWRIGKQWKTILGRGQASSWMHPSQLQQQQQEWGTEWTLSAHQWVADSPPRCFSHFSWSFQPHRPKECFPKYTKTYTFQHGDTKHWRETYNALPLPHLGVLDRVQCHANDLYLYLLYFYIPRLVLSACTNGLRVMFFQF